MKIFDKPSSALDPIAEYQLNRAMLSATEDKTVIFKSFAGIINLLIIY